MPNTSASDFDLGKLLLIVFFYFFSLALKSGNMHFVNNHISRYRAAIVFILFILVYLHIMIVRYSYGEYFSLPANYMIMLVLYHIQNGNKKSHRFQLYLNRNL